MIESRRNRGMMEYAIRLCRKLETENARLKVALGEISREPSTKSGAVEGERCPDCNGQGQHAYMSPEGPDLDVCHSCEGSGIRRKRSAPTCSAGICVEPSHGAIGWAIRRIESATEHSVTLNDGVSFSSPCFSGAKAGEIWAVKHEPGASCFGAVNRAVLLEPNATVEAPRNNEIRT